MLFLFTWHMSHRLATNNWLLLTLTPRPTPRPHPLSLSWACLPFLSSFWDQPFKNQENLALFQSERDDLFKELRELPRYSAIRKINDLVKRARPVTTSVSLPLPYPSPSLHLHRRDVLEGLGVGCVVCLSTPPASSRDGTLR